jgi:dTDP-4-dehydrorhamnose reductase
MKVLVLGHKGMLGHMVLKYFKTKNITIETTNLRWPTEEFKNKIKNYDGDFIVNCIGAIHQRTNNFDINWELPTFLDFYSNCKIIHPGTDCEMDNDNYGRSKKIARDFIVNTSQNTKSIKTSILGPELNSKASLMEWFLSNEDNSTINGYSQYFWNGNTTLTWAEQAYQFINKWETFNKETIISSICISKKEILESINEVFNRKINIIGEENVVFNKCLDGHITTPHIKIQLKTLKEFYYDKN